MEQFNSGRVAQLGEHLLCKQGVGGSSPLTSTNSVSFLTYRSVPREVSTAWSMPTQVSSDNPDGFPDELRVDDFLE
jgi:hypothetical protein